MYFFKNKHMFFYFNWLISWINYFFIIFCA